MLLLINFGLLFVYCGFIYIFTSNYLKQWTCIKGENEAFEFLSLNNNNVMSCTLQLQVFLLFSI